MSWSDEVWNSLVGSWRLLLRDTDGFENFNLNVSGFWRSFAAIVALAPMYLYASQIQSGAPVTGQPETVPTPLGLVTVGLAVQWIAWPLVMAVVARFTNLAHNYARYIVIYNWSSILVVLMQVPAVLLMSLGESAMDLANIFYLVSLGVLLYYRWYIAQTALETTTALAWALVLGDLVVSIGIMRLIG